MIYGYARVSTKGQEAYGNSLEDQEAKLREAGCEEIFHDAFTGTKMDRPEFTRLLAKLKSGDRLVVTKLDRFARTASDGIKCVQELMDRGVGVHVLNMGLMDNTATGKLIVTIMLAFAEFERNCIIERTQAGKAVAKANNPEYREGRRAIEYDAQLAADLSAMVDEHALTVSEACDRLGVGRTKWYEIAKGLHTAA